MGLCGDLIASRTSPSTAFEGAAIDSRAVREHDLFFALHGGNHDAHDFVPQAFEAGAAGAVVSHPIDAPDAKAVFHVTDTLSALQRLAAYWRSRHTVRVVGITGSVGKTTAKEILAQVLAHRFNTLKTEANLNTEIGVPLTLLQLEPDHERAVLEMGMYQPGDIRLLAEIARPDVGVVLNVGPVHMERAGSIGRIASAKAELVEALPADGLAVLNADDARVAAMARLAACRTVTFGLSEQAEIRATEIFSRGLDGFSFKLTVPGESPVVVECGLPGKHHVHPVLAAITVAINEGMPLTDVVAAIRDTRIDIRLTVRPGINGATLIDDSYNASPPSMIAALDLLAETQGRSIAILGHMRELGAAETEGHIAVGRHAAETIDVLAVVGADAALIAEEAESAGHRDVRRFGSPNEAADQLRRELRDGDHVLIKASRAVGLESVVEALVRS
jgi:UDP-N-acetylmuramoyl-tripeptide--D-alanyl-D-alanine ligase